MSRTPWSFGAALLGVAALGTVALATPASARVFVRFGFGVPVARPVVVAPAPMIYPAPVVVAQPSYISQPTSSWYYCDAAHAYYPTVTTCATPWRPVPAAAP